MSPYFKANKAKDSGRRSGKQEEPKALVTLDGEGVDWTSHSEDEQENYALMAYSNSGSDTEVTSCSKECKESYVKLKKLYDEQREQLGDASIEIQAYTQALKKSKSSESDFNSCESNSSEETLTSMPELVVNEPKVVSQHKVWSDAPIIEKYESDSDVNCVSTHAKDRKTLVLLLLILFSHLIRDCDFHVKRMAKQAELNKRMCKGTGKRENKPVWNNVQRLNHQNQFVPKVVLTRTGRIPVNTARASSTNNVNTARHNFNSQAAPTNAARKVNIVKPIVNNVRPKTIFHKTQSPIRRPFYRTTAPRTNFSNQKVNTAKDDPHKALENKGIFDSGCSRHMTGNKAYLAEYQDYNGGPVAFGGSKGYITVKDGFVTWKNLVLLSQTLNNIVPSGGLAFLIAKATVDESNQWHRRLGHDVPHKALENKGIVDSGCSRHMTGNKAYLAEYQDYNGGPVAFGGSKGYITGKGPKEANHSACTQDNIDVANSEMEAESAQYYFVLPIWSSYTSTVKSSEAKNKGEKPNKSIEKLVDQEDQAFLEELERLKSQEKEANDAAEALRKEFAKDTADLLLNAGAARASSTNTVNTASTPVSTASPSGGLSYTDLTNSDQDDSQKPALEDSYDNPNDGIFTNASYDDEGAVADFTNLETIVNVSPIPTSRIHSVHPSIQILGDPKLAVLEPMLLYLKHLKMKVGLMLYKKNYCNSRFRKFGFLWICLIGRRQLGQNRFTEIRRMKEVLWLEIRQGWLPKDIGKRKG
ncbi:hypothetical protein Tco_0431888 [Tanacetum coccineum]